MKDHEGFLCRHPEKEKEVNLDEHHVVVRRDEWLKVRIYINSQGKSMRHRYGLMRLGEK